METLFKLVTSISILSTFIYSCPPNLTSLASFLDDRNEIWTVGSTVKLQAKISRSSKSHLKIRSELVLLNNTIVATGYAELYRKGCPTVVKDNNFYMSCNEFLDYVIINIFIENAHNKSSVIVTIYNLPSRCEWQIFSPVIILQYCFPPTLPSDLRPFNYENQPRYGFNEGVSVTCIDGDLFDRNGTYAERTTATCSQHAKWNVTCKTCICEFACSKPVIRDEFLFPHLSQNKYKQQKYEMVCRKPAALINETEPKHIIESGKSFTECSNGSWLQPSVMCWEGQVVDFKQTLVTLERDRPTIFSCGQRDQNKTSLYSIWIDNKQLSVESNGSTFVNHTLIDDFFVKFAYCRRKNSDGFVEESRVTLNVTYKPVMLKKDLTYGLKEENNSIVVIEFYANPPLATSDVNVQKNGSSFDDYFVDVTGVFHRIVLGFLKVDSSSFGLYNLHLYQYSKRVQTELSFTIYAVPTTKALGLWEGVGIGASSMLALIAGALLLGVVISRRKNMSPPEIPVQRNSNSGVFVEDEYEDPNNYEDVEDDKRRKSRVQSMNPYFVRPSGGSLIEQPHYVQPDSTSDDYQCPIPFPHRSGKVPQNSDPNSMYESW